MRGIAKQHTPIGPFGRQKRTWATWGEFTWYAHADRNKQARFQNKGFHEAQVELGVDGPGRTAEHPGPGQPQGPPSARLGGHAGESFLVRCGTNIPSSSRRAIHKIEVQTRRLRSTGPGRFYAGAAYNLLWNPITSSGAARDAISAPQFPYVIVTMRSSI